MICAFVVQIWFSHDLSHIAFRHCVTGKMNFIFSPFFRVIKVLLKYIYVQRMWVHQRTRVTVTVHVVVPVLVVGKIPFSPKTHSLVIVLEVSCVSQNLWTKSTGYPRSALCFRE